MPEEEFIEALRRDIKAAEKEIKKAEEELARAEEAGIDVSKEREELTKWIELKERIQGAYGL